MRLATFATSKGPTTAVAGAGGWHDLGAPLDDLLREDRLATALAASTEAPIVSAESLRIAPLQQPRSIIAVGLNYRDHAAEAGMDLPEWPLLFAKLPGSVIGPGAPIEVDEEQTGMVDWEVELALVIGATARDLNPDLALDCVLGWTVANDVSARDLQAKDTQWLRGKSLDTFCPLGPELVSTDELGDVGSLRLWTEVDGERVQDGNTGEMHFGPAELVSWISNQFTLLPGDLVLTGTPAGVGVGMKPPRRLLPGSHVTCGVEGIGELSNSVRARAAA